MNNQLDKIVIDCQLLQTGAWDRGMGKYCLNLLSTFSSQYSYATKFILIFNKNIPTPKERIERICDSIINSEMVNLNLSYQAEVKQGRANNKVILNNFIRENFGKEKVHFLMLSNFTFDYVATFPDHAQKSVLLYDLIPLNKWDSFKDMFAPVTYFEHFKDFTESEMIFSISESAKKDAVDLLGIPDYKIINISGATIPRETSGETPSGDIRDILKERFILFPSADFAHKNNENMADAFKDFNNQLGGQFKLIITSSFSKLTEYKIKSISPNIIFTGNVSDTEYQKLLEKCEAIAFVSSAEGLGLPLLEAVSSNKPVVASSIKPHQEINDKAFYYCDPSDIKSISNSLMEALCKDGWEEKLAEYLTIRQERTWERSAKKLYDGLLGIGNLIYNNKSTEPLGTIKVNLDLPKLSDECIKIQKFIKSQMTNKLNIHVNIPNRHKDAPVYIDYLNTANINIKNHSNIKSIREIHVLSDSTNLYSVTKAALSDDIVILNLKPKELISYLIKKQYLAKTDEPDEVVLSNIFSKDKIYAFIELPKQFDFVKKVKDLQL